MRHYYFVGKNIRVSFYGSLKSAKLRLKIMKEQWPKLFDDVRIEL